MAEEISYLERLLQILLPKGGKAVMIEAYFDESGTHIGAPVMCVAGYIIDSGQCARFQKDWDTVLSQYGLDYFHMSECAHATEIFEKLTKAERSDICKKLIDLIKLRTELGIVISLSESDYWAVMPSDYRLDPYSFCAHYCLQGVMVWAERFKVEDKFAYFFESGHRCQKAMNAVITSLIEDPNISEWLRYTSHTFVKKEESKRMAGLCAADLLAWEWQKEYNNRFGPKRRPRRLSMESLLAKTHIGIHFTQSELKQYLDASILASQKEPVVLPIDLRRFHGPIQGFVVAYSPPRVQ